MPIVCWIPPPTKRSKSCCGPENDDFGCRITNPAARMNFHYANLENCHAATGVVIVIDVIRAFTNAAFAFSRGVDRIYPVATIAEALKLKGTRADIFACGEEGSLPPDGFDFGNSPSQSAELDLTGRSLLERTGAGTQGIVQSVSADRLVAVSFVVAAATVEHVLDFSPESVTFVIIGELYDGGKEDWACADYLVELFKGRRPDPAPSLGQLRASQDAQVLFDPALPQFPESDIHHCTSLDRFDFAMPVAKSDGRFVMQAQYP